MRDPFTSRPPAHTRTAHIPVLRSTKSMGLKQSVICLSDRVLCCPTHYTNRTYVCDRFIGQACQICDNGGLPRWIGYVGVWHELRKGKFLLELTHLAADKLAAKAEEVGSIRGWRIEIARAGDKPNGELLVRTGPSDYDAEQIPQAFDLKEQLCRMWGLQLSKPRKIEAEELIETGAANEDIPDGRASA